MKVKVHPDYKHLNRFIESIPSGMREGDEVLRDERNLLYKTTAGGIVFTVKRYKRPGLFNRFVYTFFRKTKARRSYEYAEQLLQKGIGTSAPAAYIEIKKNGLFDVGYFVSEFIGEPLLYREGNTPIRRISCGILLYFLRICTATGSYTAITMFIIYFFERKGTPTVSG